MSASLLPVFLRVDGVAAAVTGDGPTAREVAARLAGLGARVRLVSAAGASVAGCETIAAAPAASHLDGCTLLVAACDEPAADAAILEAARARGMLAVSARGPEGRAFLGACEQRGDVAVAATTCGQAPELETRIASQAASAIAPEHERLAQILASIRGKLEDRIPDDATRAAIWQQILDSPVALLLQSGSDDDAIEMAERMAWGTG